MTSIELRSKEEDAQLYQIDHIYRIEKALLSSFSDVILIRDYNGRCLKILSAPPDRMYRPANELLNKTLHEGLSKDKADIILGYVREAIETQQPVRGQYDLTIRGELISFSAVFSPIGKDCVLIVTHDITELKQVEKQLEIHALVTKNIAEGICVFRAVDGTIIYSNPKLEEMFGYEPFELIGENMSVLQYGDASADTENKVSEWIERIEGEDKFVDEIYSSRKNGDSFWVRVTVSSISHPKYGKVLVAVQTDITTDKKLLANVQMLAKLTEVISQSEDFEAAICSVLEEVGRADDWMYAEAWLPCHNEKQLKCSSATYIAQKYQEAHPNSEALVRFRQESERMLFSFGVGLPGRVYVSQVPEWQENVQRLSESVFLRRSLAAECGLAAALGVPLVVEKQVIAVLVLFRQKTTGVDSHLIANLSAIATQLSLKNSHKLLQQKLFQAKELTQIALEAVSEAVLISNNQGQIQYANSAARMLMGCSPLESAELWLADVFRTVDTTTWQLVESFASQLTDRQLIAQALTIPAQLELSQLELSLLNQDGSKIAQSTKIEAIKSSEGEKLGTIWIFQCEPFAPNRN